MLLEALLVMSISLDNRAFDPRTGELLENVKCEEFHNEINQNIDKIRGQRSGGTINEGKPLPLSEETATKVSEAKQAGCNPDPDWATKPGRRLPNTGDVTKSGYTPLAPGEKSIPKTSPYTLGKDIPFLDGTPLPAPQIPAEPPSYDFPYADSPPYPEPPPPQLNCGQKAAVWANFLTGLKGGLRPKYKDDCAWLDSENIPRSSPNKPETECDEPLIGSFGLIFSVYNNQLQSVDINRFWTRTPESTKTSPEESVIYKNNHTGEANEPGGCRLANYRSCGKDGDIILVQTKQGATEKTLYDRFVLYANGQFYEAQNSDNAIRAGALNNEYSSMTYEVVRPSCINVK
ncbi:MAG: hypothetical protein COV36_06115 [Alphaproteobacteria bacterium CG11_big_fil_rev_8_21_14_0_20_44_7]|nr:MAG: hypothetical protein COV36_06115 [Alphaproteobacteria bacterium CG11_big_fil_rev_8_21_14_0_20_44_7]